MDFNRFREIQEERVRLCELKNRLYGDRSLKRFGTAGIAVRIIDKAERLATMAVENRHARGRKAKAITDSIIDTLRDIGNYSVMGEMFEDGTFDGSEEVTHAVEPDSGRVRGRGGRRAKGRRPRA